MIYIKNKNSFKDHSQDSNDNGNKEFNLEKSMSWKTLKRGGGKEEKVNEFDLDGDKS